LFKRFAVRLYPVTSGRTGAQLAHQWRMDADELADLPRSRLVALQLSCSWPIPSQPRWKTSTPVAQVASPSIFDPKEGTDGLSVWTATVATEDGVKLAVCEADSPSAAMAGATTAANDSLARIHLAGRIGSEELQEKLGIETLADGVTRILSQAS
jgi:hypothetical protein